MKKKTIINALIALEALHTTEEEKKAIDLLTKLAEGIEEKESATAGIAGDEFGVPKEAADVDAFTLYSDGACRGNPGPGAWGSLGQDPAGTLLFEISGIDFRTTNNRMELEGAIKAIETFIEHLEVNELPLSTPVFLYSDSKYVVDGLEKWVPGWKGRGWKKADKKAPENLELWQQLDALKGRVPQINLRWVKGHAGHPQNERCDQLANIALDEAGVS
jgi:ribonuclease HI